MRVETGKDRPVAVAIIGMPRSGSTIVTAFVNALDLSSIWGEPHRSKMTKVFKTRYGDTPLDPKQDRLEQMRKFAVAKGLRVYGFKEVWDMNLDVWPAEVASRYGNRLDHILLTIRDPLISYSSMVALGHANHTTIEEFQTYRPCSEEKGFCYQ